MSGRTARTMIAETTFGGEIEYRTAGSYTLAGVMNIGGKWQIAAVGNSPESVRRRTRSELSKIRPGILRMPGASYCTETVRLIEATAPVVRDYFKTHSVTVTGWFTEAEGWQYGSRRAGRSVLRQMARDGVRTVQFSNGRGRGRGRRDVDFQMTELLTSMNARNQDKTAVTVLQ